MKQETFAITNLRPFCASVYKKHKAPYEAGPGRKLSAQHVVYAGNKLQATERAIELFWSSETHSIEIEPVAFPSTQLVID